MAPLARLDADGNRRSSPMIVELILAPGWADRHRRLGTMVLVFLLVAHFQGPPDPDDPAAVALLAAQPTCRRLWFARSTENAEARVLVAEFGSAAEYRRALAPFDVRTMVVPWLSRAVIDPSGVFEVLAGADGGELDVHVPTVDDPGR